MRAVLRNRRRERMMRRTPLLAAAGAVALAAAGCGSSSHSSSSSSAAATTGSAQNASSSGGAYGAPATTTSSASTASGATGTLVVVKSSKNGKVLAAGPKKLTVYEFAADHGTTSVCTGPCASVWPPVTSAATPRATGGASASMLSVVTRPDGTNQVTYNGHPLYFYARDGDSGDAYGQGISSFGASWYVLSPAGAKVDNS
jgi:predicted lipoprotein with Yx(FWY)xxD motif